MRQTSLLDSFVKKANKSHESTNKQQTQSQLTSSAQNQLSSSSKQNNQNIKHQEKVITHQEKVNPIDDKLKKMQTIKNNQYLHSNTKVETKPQRMQIEDNNYVYRTQKKQQQKDQFIPKKLQVSANPTLKATNNKTTNKSINQGKSGKQSKKKSKMDIESQDQQFHVQPNSQSESLQDELQQQCSQEGFGDDQQSFEKKPKRNTRKKNGPNKVTKSITAIKPQNESGQNLQIQSLPQKLVGSSNFQPSQIYQFDRSKFSDGTPVWAIPGNPICLDKYGNSSTATTYDETTLKVPSNFWQNLSAPMRQYWKIKSQNFDKVVFFKLGKFYQLFYQDALVGNQLLQLKWMGTKMHVGFPEKSLQRYTKQLVKFGLKVVVVQQMQTPAQMDVRIKQQKKDGIKSQKTLRREVTQIITKGTILCQDQAQMYLPNYLLSVYRYQQNIAYSLLQISTNLILLGIVNGFEQLKTVLYQTRPSELLYDPDNLPREWVDVMKMNIQGMILSKLINKQNLWHSLGALNQLKSMEDKKQIKRQQIMDEIQKFPSIQRNLLFSTLSGLFEYLHRIHKFSYVLSTAKFAFYERQKAQTHMILDSQALQHLQIFQTSLGQIGSLFSKIDHTKTKFGRRMLRRWMISPLLSVSQIQQRLDSIQDLKSFGQKLDRMQSILSQLPDMQKLVNRLYKYSVTNTSAATAVYFQDLNTARLKQFQTWMKSVQNSLIVFRTIQDNFEGMKSKRLKRIVTRMDCQKDEMDIQGLSNNLTDEVFYEDQQNDLNEQVQNKQLYKIKGLMPDVIKHLLTFKQFVTWSNGKPFPKKGILPSYDSLVETQTELKKKLDKQLETLRASFNCKDINYAHIKQQYQVQIPQRKNLKIPKEYTFSSRKAGFSRYLVQSVQQIAGELQMVQKKIKQQMGVFVSFFFEQFKQKQSVWERYVILLAQVDCYVSMAVYSKLRKTCRPNFVAAGYQIKQGVHPALYTSDFVSNNISFAAPIIILTGPNMGGKSTILRTTCLLAVLAQMGSFVPCQSYRSSIIDRIFTRIGASDMLEAGKSTFFIELEQTKSILEKATKRSLAIIDELGRGTATYDGMALAHSVLDYIIKKIGCKCMFATHYHSLTQQFANMSQTVLKMMDYEIIQGEQDRIEFLYKLVNGKAQKSFGLNVAQLVGLPKQVINLARHKSDQMHKIIQEKKNKVKVYEVLNTIYKR